MELSRPRVAECLFAFLRRLLPQHSEPRCQKPNMSFGLLLAVSMQTGAAEAALQAGLQESPVMGQKTAPAGAALCSKHNSFPSLKGPEPTRSQEGHGPGWQPLTAGCSGPPGRSSFSTVLRQSGHTQSGRCSTLLPLGGMDRASRLAVCIPLSEEESLRSLLHSRQHSPAGWAGALGLRPKPKGACNTQTKFHSENQDC